MAMVDPRFQPGSPYWSAPALPSRFLPIDMTRGADGLAGIPTQIPGAAGGGLLAMPAGPQPAPQAPVAAAMPTGPAMMANAAPAAPQAAQPRYMMGGPFGDFLRNNNTALQTLAAGLLSGSRRGLSGAIGSLPQAQAMDRQAAAMGQLTEGLDPKMAALARAFPQLYAQQQFAAPESTGNIRDFEFSQRNPAFGAFLRGNRAAGATRIDLADQSPFQFGEPKKDWMYGIGADGEPYARPIPGTEAFDEWKRGQVAGDRKTVDATAEASRMGGIVSDIIDLKDDFVARGGDPSFLTGTNSRLTGWHSDLPAGKIRSKINGLKSGVALGALLRLKEASPTGASGFGALNRSELQLLIDKFGSLDPDTTSWPVIEQTLMEIDRQYGRVIEDIKREVDPAKIRELGLQPLIDAYARGEAPSSRDEGWTEIDGVRVRVK